MVPPATPVPLVGADQPAPLPSPPPGATEPAHAILGASSAHRWMECPGSVRLSADLWNQSNLAAHEGSAAHHLARAAVLNKPIQRLQGGGISYRGIVYKSLPHLSQWPDGDPVFEITAEMIAGAMLYGETVRQQAATAGHPAAIDLEVRLSLEAIGPGLFGTGDAVVVGPDQLSVTDFKYGKGVVEVAGNPQLLYYALGALLREEARPHGQRPPVIETVIVQPRATHPDGPVRRALYTFTEVRYAFADRLRAAVARAQDPAAPLIADPEQCQWCPAKLICAAYEAMERA